MRNYVFAMALLGFSFLAQARPSSFALSLEPIAGYEAAYRTDPSPHTQGELVYGGRVLLGWRLIALEGEFLHGTSSQTTIDTTNEFKLGMRAGFRLYREITMFARGGVDELQDSVNGASNTTNYYPYAGIGFGFDAGRRLVLTLELVAVFTSWPNMNANSYEPTIGLTLRIP
jgi:hypothetical protein